MIEVEKKFALTDDETTSLLDGARFVGEYQISDTYFDVEWFTLTRKGWWLRARDDQFELKSSLAKAGTNHDTSVFRETTDNARIREMIGLKVSNILIPDDLIAEGYVPFCTVSTVRKKYQKDGLDIDIDLANFPDFSYASCEIEVGVEDQSQVAGAVEKILNFAQMQGLKMNPVKGKIIEYLRVMRPDHYKALVEAGVIKEG